MTDLLTQIRDAVSRTRGERRPWDSPALKSRMARLDAGLVLLGEVTRVLDEYEMNRYAGYADLHEALSVVTQDIHALRQRHHVPFTPERLLDLFDLRLLLGKVPS
jgi:hypothetical protein